MESDEIECVVDGLIIAGSTAVIAWGDAQNVLLWVKSRLGVVGSSQNQGLVGRTLAVLGKLVSRKSEEWL